MNINKCIKNFDWCRKWKMSQKKTLRNFKKKLEGRQILRNINALKPYFFRDCSFEEVARLIYMRF